jgi:ABC-type transporter Mla maintaining outer membrane lipid asymmetry ATPase subunit MlaF
MRILRGASGAGKSLLLKLILGLLRPDSGRILINGQRIDDMRERDCCRRGPTSRGGAGACRGSPGLHRPG